MAGDRPASARARAHLIGLSTGVLVLLFMGALELNYLFTPVNPGGEVRFVIPQGASARQIADILHEAGLIKSPVLFRLIAKNRGLDGRLRAGDYLLEAGLPMSEIIDRLEKGQVHTQAVTIPEGMTVVQIAELLDEKGIVKRDDFLQAARNKDLVSEFLPDDPAIREPLEGYLFPDTYRFGKGATSEEIVRLMVDTLKSHLTAEVRQQLAARNMTFHQVLTLASIIEREAIVDEERPIIAGVYTNRLRMKMKLDADPTVLYAHGRTHGLLTLKDLEVVSPYNTYRAIGLPPGPIAAPGLKSIQAALNPADVDYLYFVARNDNTHVFSRTLAEHNANVRRYQSR